MALDKSSIKGYFEASGCYRSLLDCSFGIHTSLEADGIPSYRIVYLNTEANNINESITDNPTVGYVGTTDATTVVAGVVKDGCVPDTSVSYLPGFNRDLNVTVTLFGTMILTVGATQVIAPGDDVGSDPEGKAVAGGGTGIIALSGASGVGTAANPEYIVALVRNPAQ